MSIRKKVLLGAAGVIFAAVAIVGAWAAIANVNSKWSGGDLVFYDKSTKATIFTIADGADGVTAAGSFTVSGTASLGTATITTPTMTSVDINGGSIDGVTIGAAAAPTVTNLGAVATCDINGGTIDGVTIGAAAAPTVTNLGAVATCDINGGTVDGAIIGGSTPAAGSFTTLAASGTAAITGAFTRDEVILTPTAVSLTSPTVAVDVSGKGYVILQSDANQTGAYLTSGTVNQVVVIRTGAGSNTIRFDDATSCVLGGNVTLTEGQGDILTFVADGTDATIWYCISAHDN